MYSNQWDQYLYELNQYIRQQDAMIRSLEERVERLERELNQKSSTTIENIEYKFDQLKIEHLAGALHIGLSPEELKNVEDFAVNQSGKPTNQTMNDPLKSELDSFVQKEGPGLLHNLAREYEYFLDDSFKSILLQDIQKQLPDRINFYKQEALRNNDSIDKQELRQFIVSNIKQEIQGSLRNYIEKNKGKGEKK